MTSPNKLIALQNSGVILHLQVTLRGTREKGQLQSAQALKVFRSCAQY